MKIQLIYKNWSYILVITIISSRDHHRDPWANCHLGEHAEEKLSLRTFNENLAGSNHHPVVILGVVEGSLSIEMIANKEMPKRSPKFTPTQFQFIFDQLTAGAPNYYTPTTAKNTHANS